MKRNRKHPQGDSIEVDTSNILFICSGAFVGLDTIKRNSTGVGFLHPEADKKVKFSETTDDHLIKYGLIPEFVGRVGSIVELQKLTVKELEDIIKVSSISPLKQYQMVFDTESVELTIEDEAITKIAENCWNSDIGARGIKNYFDKILKQTLFNIHALKKKKLAKILIKCDSVDNMSDPLYTFN
jgi:ATP-dependent Clp protease ATP-binding subunit ClpX